MDQYGIDAFCDKPKRPGQLGPREYLGMKLIITAPDNEDLYLIGQSMDIFHWTNNYDYYGNSFDEDRCGNNDNCHKLLAGESTIIEMMNANHFFGGEVSDYRAKSRKIWKDGSAFYASEYELTSFVPAHITCILVSDTYVLPLSSLYCSATRWNLLLHWLESEPIHWFT